MDITVRGFKKADTYEAISSKSYVHRLLIAAALSEKPVRIKTNIRSEDMEATAECLRAMGAEISYEDGAYEVRGVTKASGSLQNRAGIGVPDGTDIPAPVWTVEDENSVVLDCAESGSTERFLLPVAVHLCGSVTLKGRGRLPMRPLDTFTDVLADHGVSFRKHSEDAVLPITASGRLEPGAYEIAGNVSSQYITGLLFALPLLDGDSTIILTTPLESAGYIDITLDVLSRFGIGIERKPNGFFVKGRQSYGESLEASYKAKGSRHGARESAGEQIRTIQAEGDWSNAAVFLAFGAIKGKVRVTGLNTESVQGDARVVDVLRQFGAKVSTETPEASGKKGKGKTKDRETVGTGAVLAEHDRLEGIDTDVSQIPDLVPVLAVTAFFASSESIFRNVSRLRLKESDRVESVVKLAETFGAQAVAQKRGTREDLRIIPRGIAKRKEGSQASEGAGFEPITADSANDHRIVMALALASEAAGVPVKITGAEAVNKSFPGFFDMCVTDALKKELPKGGRCVLICAGPDDGNVPAHAEGDLVIAADAGYLHAKRCGVVPDVVVGDFDSMKRIPEGLPIVKLSPVKDDTDTVSAIKLGLEKGCRVFEIYFATGGRTAHTLANIQCLKFIKDRGADGIIYDKNTAIRLLRNESFDFDEGYKGYISVFALGRAKGVDIKGLKYEVNDSELDNGFPLGVSNEFVGRRAKVSVRDGELLVLYERKPEAGDA
ncbi:MAG: thiamine diphosphokinase [Lachnospiraceae bacterium]|nr:thiamine diphosphokinase [Lachnospiraceae bacterium]